MKVLTIFLTLFLWTEERKALSTKQKEEAREALSELEFYNARFLDLSRAYYRYLEEDIDPILQADLFEGDIDLGNISVSQLLNNSKAAGKNAIRDLKDRWPNATVPYQISNIFGKRERILIARAMMEFHLKTCIRFVPKASDHKDHIYFIQGRGCYSRIGRVGGAQNVSLGRGCHHLGIIVHELIHCLGFWHEQSRADRDDYVTIVWGNIQKEKGYNFDKHSWAYMQSLNESYDYGSIMHYGAYAFAINNTQPTIIPKKKGNAIGQRKTFSEVDLKKINKLYECSAAGSECVDVDGRCVDWAEKGLCERNDMWIRPNCLKACGLCGYRLGCEDLNKRCPEWNKAGLCDKYPGYMKKFCPKSCKACNE